MDTYKDIKLSQDLVKDLEDIAKSNNTDIDNTIKLLLIENRELKNPSYLTTTKVSKNKSTYSSVIPAPIKNKFNLEKGQVLYWDIEDNKIIITPELISDDLPESPSIEAGVKILNDVLFNDISDNDYSSFCKIILNEFETETNKEDKLNKLIGIYKNCQGKEKDIYKTLVLYLLDYPLEINQTEVLKEVYKEINKLDKSSN